MEDDPIAKLEARLDWAEAKIEDLTAMAEIWEDRVVMPALLLLASHGYRREIETMLSQAEKAAEHLDMLERQPFFQARLRHWAEAAKAIGPAPRFAPPDP